MHASSILFACIILNINHGLICSKTEVNYFFTKSSAQLIA